ncbi:MAG TPA: hypothetical protein DCY17_03545, partial [Clostridiales bacterium]|nr:hypothetical protein [Clostridiales bacterium]
IQEECEFVQYFFCIFWQKNVNYSAHSPQSRKNGKKTPAGLQKSQYGHFFEIAHIRCCGTMRVLYMKPADKDRSRKQTNRT